MLLERRAGPREKESERGAFVSALDCLLEEEKLLLFLTHWKPQFFEGAGLVLRPPPLLLAIKHQNKGNNQILELAQNCALSLPKDDWFGLVWLSFNPAVRLLPVVVKLFRLARTVRLSFHVIPLHYYGANPHMHWEFHFRIFGVSSPHPKDYISKGINLPTCKFFFSSFHLPKSFIMAGGKKKKGGHISAKHAAESPLFWRKWNSNRLWLDGSRLAA